MAKLQIAFSERRRQERKTLTGLMPGRLFLVTTDRTVSARPVDVSARGLGILCNEKFEEGAEVGLSIDSERTIIFRIIWRKEDFGKRDLYRYGLESLDASMNLEQVFLSTGCMK